MVEISIADDEVVFEVHGLDKLWSLKSQIRIPLSHVVEATIDRDAARGWYHGLRLPGTQIPGIITAGTFYQHGRRVFFDVHNTDNTIVITLSHDRYDHLVIEVADPDAEVRKINAALVRRPG
jgi:hypothetical protein